MKKSQNIHIGHCTQPHGIRGEFTFVLYNSESNLLKKNSIIFLSAKNEKSSLQVEFEKFIISKINYGNKIIVSLEGVVTRNQVEAMLPFDIYARREDLPELQNNEFYLNDLHGCRVMNNISKIELGVVDDFYENGEQVILVIKTNNGKFDILFTNYFVPVVDLKNRIIEIIEPEIIE